MHQLMNETWIVKCLTIFNGLLLGTSLVAFVDSFWFTFLLDQFRLVLLLFLLVALVSMIFLRLWRNVAVSAIGVLVNVFAIQLWLFYLPLGETEVSATAMKIRLLQMNVEYINTDYALATALIKSKEADVIVIEELTGLWLGALEPVLAKYPYRVAVPQDNTYGNGIFSKYPIKSSETRFFGPRVHPTIRADIQVGSHLISVVHTHLQGPGSPRYHSMHLTEVAGVGSILQKSSSDAIFCGDMNSSSWCNPLRGLVEKEHLRDTRLSRGLQLSWPTRKRFPYFPILAIDHCFTRGNIKVVERELGPYIASDHYPVIVDLLLD